MNDEHNSPIYVSLDLEMNQPSGKIIEIGVTVGNAYKREIIEKKHFFVNPNENLSEYIIRLTTIKQADVDAAKPLHEAYLDLCQYLKPFKFRQCVVTWGGGDHYLLKNQLQETGMPYEWILGHSYINVKTIHQSLMISKNEKTQGGLAKSILKYGMHFKGTKHRAIDDAYNTMKLWFKMLDMLETIQK